MTGNYPSGFDGFQARMEATIEACGGDWLARASVEEEFQRTLARAVRKREQGTDQERPFDYRRQFKSEWMAATALDFNHAGEEAEQGFFFPDDQLPDVPEGQRFVLRWGKQAIARCTRQAGIILCTRRGQSFHFTDAGGWLSRDNGYPLRSHHRHLRTDAAADSFFERLAQRELKL